MSVEQPLGHDTRLKMVICHLEQHLDVAEGQEVGVLQAARRLLVGLLDRIEQTNAHACVVCGKPFNVGGGVKNGFHRRGKEVCGDSCRVKKNRQRQDRARLMLAQGRSVQEIATALNASLESVERWTAKAQPLPA